MEQISSVKVPLKLTEHEDPYYLKDEALLEVYKNSLPPEEAYLYFPKGEEVIVPNSKKPEKALRRIYYNVAFTEKEKAWIQEFKAELSKHRDLKLPEDWCDEMSLIYIYAAECKMPNSYERLINYMAWHKSFFPLNFQPKDKVCELLNSGFCYCYGRDHQFRPLIIVQPFIYKDRMDYFSEEDLRKATIFLCEYIMNNMLIKGQIENWIMIINCKDVGVLSLPAPVRKVIGELSNNFLAKLYRSYFFNMTTVTSILYSFVCKFLEEVTVRKFVKIGNKDSHKIFDYIRRDNLEKKFGGTAPDLNYNQPNALFPPRMPSKEFLLEKEDKNKILITEEEYINLSKGDRFPKESFSPFIKEKLRVKEEGERLAKEKRDKEEKVKNLNAQRQKLSLKSVQDIKLLFKGINLGIESEEPDADFIFDKVRVKTTGNTRSQTLSFEQAVLNFNKRKKSYSSKMRNLISIKI